MELIDLLKLVDKEHNVIEINCNNVNNPGEFISNFARQIHQNSKYDVAYVKNKENVYHMILGEMKWNVHIVEKSMICTRGWLL